VALCLNHFPTPSQLKSSLTSTYFISFLLNCGAKGLSGSLIQRQCYIYTAREYAPKTSSPISLRSRANIVNSRLCLCPSAIFTPSIVDRASCVYPHEEIVHLRSRLEKRTRSADVFSWTAPLGLPSTAQWINSVIIERRVHSHSTTKTFLNHLRTLVLEMVGPWSPNHPRAPSLASRAAEHILESPCDHENGQRVFKFDWFGAPRIQFPRCRDQSRLQLVCHWEVRDNSQGQTQNSGAVFAIRLNLSAGCCRVMRVFQAHR
jgi:hypothetical protein